MTMYDLLDKYILEYHDKFEELPWLRDMLYDLQEKSCEDEEKEWEDEIRDIFEE